MGRKVVVEWIDDIDNSLPADESIEFGLDGVEYEIDLSSKNAERLREELALWIASGRVKSGRVKKRKTSGVNAAAAQSESALIRAWAPKRGLKVNAKGRIPKRVIEQFRAEAGVPALQ